MQIDNKAIVSTVLVFNIQTISSDLKRATHAIPSGNLNNLTFPISKEKGSSYYKNLRKCLSFIVYL